VLIERALGPEHSRMVRPLNTLIGALGLLRDLPAVLEQSQRLKRITLAATPPGSVARALPYRQLALAYARIQDGVAVLVVATRLAYTLCRGEDSRWSPALWRGTQLALAAESANVRRFRRWRNWLTGAGCALAGDGPLELSTVFEGAGGLPFAVLVAPAEAA